MFTGEDTWWQTGSLEENEQGRGHEVGKVTGSWETVRNRKGTVRTGGTQRQQKRK